MGCLVVPLLMVALLGYSVGEAFISSILLFVVVGICMLFSGKAS